MVMNSQAQVNEALSDFQSGEFGVPWPHELDDAEWEQLCDKRAAARGIGM